MKKRLLGIMLGALAAGSVQAAALDVGKISSQGQAVFKALSEDLAAALSYKAITPAEPLGVVGFDLGVEVTGTQPANAKDWAAAVGESDVSLLPAPKLHAFKGLPLSLDVGAVYSAIPGTGIQYYGGELRYSFVSGNVAIPALAIRGAYTALTGVDTLEMNTKSVELTVSKGFLMFTPYAGIGQVWATSTPSGSVANVFSEESLSLSKWYVGININMGLVNLAFETDQTGDATSYSGKLGFRF